MFAKHVIGYALILVVAVALIAVWRFLVKRRRRERSSSRINLID